MYSIYEKDGVFHCEGRIQDGTERWTRPTLDEAVKSMKQFARTMNHTKIKRKDITFYRLAVPTTPQFVECPIPKKGT